MLVSWKWLKEYVDLDMTSSELEQRLAMSGLNHEGTESIADDLCIDLEVTSNRADCLGHIGVAREVSVLYEVPLRIPTVELPAGTGDVSKDLSVEIACPDLCYRYTARVIRGVRIGPSPAWLQERLATVGVKSINNVVDITNYVLLECGQPLHAFDLAKLSGNKIIVRNARDREEFLAIDHEKYVLDKEMCVIADADRAVALAGVMGGEESEVSDSTTDLLIESAEFAPLSVRTTARQLRLHSPSSYRFERRIDPAGVDWASRRCCALILELAGGSLAEGVIDVGPESPTREPVTLRLAQLERILGIDIPADDVARILQTLGNEQLSRDDEAIVVRPPTWRRDLTREIDLVEEIARIHGYEKIPEDAGVPMVPSHRHDWERVQSIIRTLLTGLGFDEAMTTSVVPVEWTKLFSPWTEAEALRTDTPMLKGADCVRSSLTPSLVQARRNNEVMANPVIELFETARVYLPGDSKQPHEQNTLAITSGGDYYHVKGVLEAVLHSLNPAIELEVRPNQQDIFDASASGELYLNGKLWGLLGSLTEGARKHFDLRNETTVAEVSIDLLNEVAELVPQHADLSLFPSMSRDLNVVMDESVDWSAIASTVREAAGELLEDVSFREIYRDEERDGADKKRVMFSIQLRSHEKSLSGEEADSVHKRVVDAIASTHGGKLLG